MQIKDTNYMGKVFTTLTLTNRADQIRTEDGTITPEQVRSVTLKNVLVDIGATTDMFTTRSSSPVRTKATSRS